MPVCSPRLSLNPIRWAMAALLAGAVVFLVARSLRWPLVWDAQVMHYANFLISRGFAPYRQIGDMTPPGSYLIEGWAMHVFGWGDLAWRFYDYTLMAVICGAMVAIAMPYDWLAGLFSGVVFALAHTAEGALESAERDEAMTALMVVAYAFLFSAVRRRSPWRMVMFGLSMGMAASIKPTVAPLGFALLLLAYWALRKQRLPAAPYLVAGCAGAAIAAAIIAAFFLRYNSFAAYYEISRNLTVHYAGLHRESLGFMLRTMLPKVATVLLPFALLAAIAGRRWNSWERNALLLGALFGAFSYFAQGKGYGYHRYPFTAFIVLWESIELTLAMRRERWIKGLGFAGMAVGVFLMVPAYAYRLAGVHPVNEYAPTLESDLNRLGGDRLQGQVQCFDMVDGCFNALYHLRLVQATTTLGDTLYFSRAANPTVDRYRAEILNQLSRNPPQVIVVSDEWYNETDSFAKLDQWPKFNDWLNANYRLFISRRFAAESNHAYRIYVHNGSGL